MDDEPAPPRREVDAQIEREIRADRKFSLAEAIGRLGGGDLMKGASPVSRKRQAELAIERYLQRHLIDSEGALQIVLLRRVKESDIMLQADYDQPLAAIETFCRRILGSAERLRSFVFAVDAEWGRMYLERPRFEIDGRPVADDDPYTFESVRRKLAQFVDAIPRE